ncbi:putative LRR receptor-like serine/threonine-protein kinase [Camellia lanceoleosa]|uniref:LRR receptor-like serine/threonine-protein kinase n=1 Tax=Camellia lanceoleosa TaxID=1840588 RepID=A0ACC0IZY5_9ERIC|nr:putative LRR receptor-like serine/threonine-protein kinase [Camellia lanceoleosa]
MKRGYQESSSSGSLRLPQSKIRHNPEGDARFLEDESTKVFDRKVADHYSARMNQTLEEQGASPIIHLKKLNNCTQFLILHVASFVLKKDSQFCQRHARSVSSNNFSGPLPSELGNLAKLEQLYIDSSGLSGAIPSSFAALQNMKTVWASDTELNGSIPDFIGNWSKLTTLDLSFNNLTGRIPDALFNLSSLFYLFLGNNKLTGTLPAQMSTSLLNIDLSYNELSGSFPSWISKQGLQLNIVANNFTVESSNNRVLPSGLRCLQRNFPCYRNSPVC